MYKIKIYTIGKTKDPWLITALQEYEKRLLSTMLFEWHIFKKMEELGAKLAKESSYICLDLEGKALSSEEFSRFLFQELEHRGCQVAFVIGGDEGIDPKIKKGASHALQFSKMTLTHQMVRLLLIEQIYRADQIAKGTSYHK